MNTQNELQRSLDLNLWNSLKVLICMSLVLLIIAFPMELLAQDLEKPRPLITNLKKDEPAPFDGVLLDSWAMSEIMAEMEYDQKRFELELDFIKKKKDAECSLEYETLKASFDSLKFKHKEVLEIKDTEIENLREITTQKKDYSTLWYVGGFLSGVALSVGVVYLASGAFGN